MLKGASHLNVLLLEPNSSDVESITVVATENAVDEVEGDDGLCNPEAKETVDDVGTAGATPSNVLTVVETVQGLAVVDLSFAVSLILGAFSAGEPKFTRFAEAALARYCDTAKIADSISSVENTAFIGDGWVALDRNLCIRMTSREKDRFSVTLSSPKASIEVGATAEEY